jgi:hypothetical protein
VARPAYQIVDERSLNVSFIATVDKKLQKLELKTVSLNAWVCNAV